MRDVRTEIARLGNPHHNQMIQFDATTTCPANLNCPSFAPVPRAMFTGPCRRIIHRAAFTAIVSSMLPDLINPFISLFMVDDRLFRMYVLLGIG